MSTTFVPSVGNLKVIRVYIKVNEPMLFSGKNELGDLYFVSYADSLDNGEAWIITRVSEERLRRFEIGILDIRDMFLNAETGNILFVEYDDDKPYRPSIRYFLNDDNDMRAYLADAGQKIPIPVVSKTSVVSFDKQLAYPAWLTGSKIQPAKNVSASFIINGKSTSNGVIFSTGSRPVEENKSWRKVGAA